MKKVISLFLSVAMLLSIVSVVDFSAYADVQTGKCGDNVTYSLDTSTGVLTISGKGNMKNYNDNDYDNYGNNPFYYKRSNIKTVIIKNGVTSIGDYTFYYCKSLISVTIPDSVTNIGDSAFYYCTSLTSVTIPNRVTSISDSTFRRCTSLTSITIPDSVISIGVYAFSDCTSLTNVTIGNSVTSIGECAFLRCASLISITIPNSVTSIENEAFEDCTSLKSIEVSGNNKNYSSLDGVLFNKDKSKLITYPAGKADSEYAIPNSVTSIGWYAFENCTSLTSITIPNSVTSIGGSAFDGCTSLASITIPNDVTSIGYGVFQGCTSLTSVTIPNSVTSIGSSAFSGCTSLTSVTIPNSVTSIGSSAFSGCTSLTSITIPDSVTSIGRYAFSGCESLTNIIIPNSVTSIGEYAFRSCTSLTSITIPDSVTSIGSFAFYNCKSLTKVDYNGTVSQWKSIKGYDNVSKIIKCTDGIIGNGNTVTIDNLKYKIYDDTASLVGYTDSPENLVISKNISYEGYTVTVTSIGDKAFYKCTSLTSVTIPDSVTSIGRCAFDGCTSLESVNYSGTKSQWKAITIGSDNSYLTRAFIKCTDGIIGNGNTVTVDSVKYRLNDDYTAQVISYSDTPKNITISECVSYESYTFKVTSIGESAFKGCTSLTSITIPNSVTSIGKSAFSGCTSLTSITIPNSVTSIGSSAFSGCTSLTNVTIPDSITSIGDNAFYNCKSLTSVTIPDSVTSIGDWAFENCTSLTSVTIPDSVTSIGYSAFYNTAYYNDKSNWDNGVLYISDCLIDTNYNFNSTTDYIIKDGTRIIANYAFSGCTSLTSVTIPDSVTIIGRYAFENCTSLKNIIVLSSDCKFGSYIVGKEVKIYGYKNSTANEYAVLKGNEFIEIYCNDYGLEHIYSEKVLENPTCKNNGKISYTCDRCSKIYTDTIPALGHNYVSKVIKQPTCTEKGTTRYTCSRCGDYYDKDDIAALGHDYVSKVLTQPTCTEKGVTRYTCTRCNNYYDKKDIEELGHDTKIVERVEPTLTEDGFYRVECQRDGCGYSSSHPLEQLTLGYNQKVKSNGSDTYKIEMDKSGYLIFDFEGESKEWNINIYDEDYNKIDTLKPVYKEFYKKSYLQISLGSSVPNKNQIVALFAGKYYVEIDRLNNATNDNFSGNYTFSIDYSPANETIKETKNDFYYDAPTAKNIELNKTYNGFLGAKYACYNYVGNPILTTDERDAYKIEIPKGSGLSQFSVTLSSKAFAPLGSNCTLILYNSEFEPYDGFKPLTVSLNSTLNETIYLYEGTYYIAVVNDKSPIEYTFTTTFKPQGTFTCVEHKGKLVNTVNPTCTQNGYNSYVCQICGTQYKEIIPAYGHNVVIDYEVAPTVVSSGLTRGSHCSICGAVITPQTVIPQISAPTQPTTTPTTSAKAVAKPKSAKFKKVKSAKKAISVEWKKVSGVKGYQIQVATDKKFKKNKKTVNIKKQKTTKTTVKKLKAKKKYYVRVRTYIIVNGKKVYSSWSKVKSVKTK